MLALILKQNLKTKTIGGHPPPFLSPAVGAIRKDVRGAAVAVAVAETVSEAAHSSLTP